MVSTSELNSEQFSDAQLISVTERVNQLSTSNRSTELDESTIIDTKYLSITEPKDYDADDDIPLIQLLKKSSTKPQDVKLKRKIIERSKTKKEATSSIKKSPKIKKEIVSVKKIKSELEFKSESDLDKKSFNTEEDDDEDQWWLNENFEMGYNWETLEHNGVYFPPPYQPHNVKMKYKGKDVALPPEAEEIATFFAGVIGTPYESNTTFITNFFKEFRNSLEGSVYGNMIVNFEDCDFSLIVEYLHQLKEKKKNRTEEERIEDKKVNDALVEKYGYCLLDGKKEKIGNFRVEPPGLFRGRGEHPKMGCLKGRVTPEQLTLNLGHSAKVPSPPEGHKWGKIICDPTVTWLATWTDSISGSPKYVFLAFSSKLKGISDLKKYEKARKLKSVVGIIREKIDAELLDSDITIKQRATAIWLIDRLALRAGNEKGEDEADTVGCCSLRVEHLSLEIRPDYKHLKKKLYFVIFDFLGKDSIRYFNEVSVPKLIYDNLKIFSLSSKKEKQDLLFEHLTPNAVNKYLHSFMPGLTARVFRTYNASITFQDELKNTPANGTVSEKILAYNRANRRVAVLCNHQRAIPKSHSSSMEKLLEKLKNIEQERHSIKEELRSRSYNEVSSSDEEQFESNVDKQNSISNDEQEKGDIKAGDSEMSFSSQEPKAVVSIATISTEKLCTKLQSLSARRSILKNNILEKDENKQTALGTSKLNYIDPRITVAWCKNYNVPLEKLFTKTLREKFKWASHVDEAWIF